MERTNATASSSPTRAGKVSDLTKIAVCRAVRCSQPRLQAITEQGLAGRCGRWSRPRP